MKHESHKVPPYHNSDAQILSIGLCQVETHPFECDQNRARTLKALRDAGELGCEVAITPECSVHGYGFLDDKELLKTKVTQAAETQSGALVTGAAEIAQQYKMAIAVGYAEAADGVLYNATTLLDAKGEIAAHYRKVHLRDFESHAFGSVFHPGNEFPVVDLKLRNGPLRAGIMICFDREIPESVRSLRAQGAELILCPLACDTEPLDAPQNFAENEMTTRIRAAENELYIVVNNHANRFNGGTFIVGPAGESIIQLGEAPEVKRVDLPIGGFRELFRTNPYTWMGWGYRREDVYSKYL
ncbi:carbon-nitrogen hydrolase family protein [Pelagicoccus mobilis]|uniref:Carbon-nitrogen hydrolase family protein n=1 Tax=Pelagicoccus mobilis TaxID=415221 RepID=A0A934RTA7_9BACT|nr:carbon-nitrogen hydrolase family protein [Pelagicoccus mobilis]MBK1877195.1 carbon-nitrogen hydrolase family protein [Pelagicoccus mobilis]